MPGPTAIRLDLLFAVNFVVDLLLFWFAGSISWRRPPWWRLVLVAAVGALASFLPVLVPWGWRLTSGGAVLLISVLLTLLLAWPCSSRQFAAVFGGFWLVAGLAGGVILMLAERYAIEPGWVPTVLVAVGIPTALVGIQLVWQAYRERKGVRAALYGVRIGLGDRSVELTGLVDSGNSLRTPGSGRPVAVVEADRLRPCLPAEVLEALSLGWDALSGIPPDWLSRCQIIPYRVVGSREGSLLVIAADEVAIWDRGRWVPVTGYLGLTPEPLDPHGEYSALLPPAMLQEAEGR